MWWNSLTIMQQAFFCIACITTGFMIIQAILVAVGIGGDTDFDLSGDASLDGADGDDGVGTFILRGLIAFFSIGGWVGFGLGGTSLPQWAAALIAVACGIGAFFAMALLIKAILKLQSEGNLNYANAVGLTGLVYIPIPAGRAGCGKINVTLQERLVEINAMTDDNEKLPTEMMVVVNEQVDQNTVLVSRYCAPGA